MELICDFETTVSPLESRVWAWCYCDLENTSDIHFGNDLDSFMNLFIHRKRAIKLWFHNLKFDGCYIIYWLLKHGYKHRTNKEKPTKKSFTTTIDGMGRFYAINIDIQSYNRWEKIRIYDSLKVIPYKVKDIPKKFGLEKSKGEIDYDKERPIGYEMTEEEKDYISHDVIIVAEAMQFFRQKNLKKMTIGANALADYKHMTDSRLYDKRFPQLPIEIDTEIRYSYRGAFTYLNPKYAGKEIKEGIVLDVNSLYPFVMKTCLLPYGEPVFFEGEYRKDKIYPLYIQLFKCRFKLKDGKIPCLMFNNDLSFRPGEYLIDSGLDDVMMCLTSVDLKLFREQYDILEEDMEYISGYKFKACVGMFDDYIDKWFKVKEENNDNEGIRTLAKLMLNNLYGKLATNPYVTNKIPYLDENEIVKLKVGTKEERKTVYIPAGTFITSYARDKTIRSAQSVYHRWIYSDTDSLHLEGTELPDNLEIDSVKLGAWKLEKKFDRAKFLMSKTYVEEVNGKLEICCAGMPESCYKNVTYDNFKVGAIYDGKKITKHVKGGIYLKNSEHTIRQK